MNNLAIPKTEELQVIFERFIAEAQQKVFVRNSRSHSFHDEEMHLNAVALTMGEIELLNELCKKYNLTYLLNSKSGSPSYPILIITSLDN